MSGERYMIGDGGSEQRAEAGGNCGGKGDEDVEGGCLLNAQPFCSGLYLLVASLASRLTFVGHLQGSDCRVESPLTRCGVGQIHPEKPRQTCGNVSVVVLLSRVVSRGKTIRNSRQESQ